MRSLLAVGTAGFFVLVAVAAVGVRPASAPSAMVGGVAEAPFLEPPRVILEPVARADPEPRASIAVSGDVAETHAVAEVPTTFLTPVSGGVVPSAPELLPNSLRGYRGGTHEGVDFPVLTGTPVLAAATGRISRIDYAYQEWTDPARNAALDNARRLGYTPELILDLIRGRQVWVDHGAGVVTRYAHLSAVAPLRRGDEVMSGQVIGYVGQSGYPEGGPHLHFEIRLGDTFLGAGLANPAEVRATIAGAIRAN